MPRPATYRFAFDTFISLAPSSAISTFSHLLFHFPSSPFIATTRIELVYKLKLDYQWIHPSYAYIRGMACIVYSPALLSSLYPLPPLLRRRTNETQTNNTYGKHDVLRSHQQSQPTILDYHPSLFFLTPVLQILLSRFLLQLAKSSSLWLYVLAASLKNVLVFILFITFILWT